MKRPTESVDIQAAFSCPLHGLDFSGLQPSSDCWAEVAVRFRELAAKRQSRDFSRKDRDDW